MRIFSEIWAISWWPFCSSTLNIALDNASTMVPSCSIEVCLAILKFKVLFYVLVRRKDFSSVLKYRNRMFEMGRGLSVVSPDRPPVPLLDDVSGPEVDHGLDCDHHTFGQKRAAALFAVIGNFRRLMQAFAQTMTYQLPDYGKASGFHVFLDGISDIPHPVAKDGLFDTEIQRFLCRF